MFQKQLKSCIRPLFNALLCGVFGSCCALGAGTASESSAVKNNVVWTSPSKDYNGSMPIGNGDLAANVWVEPTGDLIFYLSKSDAWTGGGPDPESDSGRRALRGVGGGPTGVAQL